MYPIRPTGRLNDLVRHMKGISIMFTNITNWWNGKSRTELPLTNGTTTQQEESGFSYHAKQLSKGAVLFGSAALVYFGLRNVFSEKDESESQPYRKSQSNLMLYKKPDKLSLQTESSSSLSSTVFDSLSKDGSLSSFTTRKLLTISEADKQDDLSLSYHHSKADQDEQSDFFQSRRKIEAATPTLGANQLTINEGQTVVLTTSMLSATDSDSNDAALVFTVNNTQYGQFEKVSVSGVPITNFTQQDIWDNKIRFVHDGGELAPSYDVKVSDGALETGYQSAAITFNSINDVPVLGNNQLTIGEGQTVFLTNSTLNATDSDTNVATLMFTVINVQYGQFEDVANPGIPITSFTQQNILDNKIYFVHDGGELAPAYDVKVSDGALDSSYQSAAITFNLVNDTPVLGNNILSINEGQTVVLTNSMLSTTDVDNNDAVLAFTVNNIQSGQFEKVSVPGVPITNFTQQDIWDNKIRFVHDGGELAPSYDVKVSDGALDSSYQPATITFNLVNDPPVLDNNHLTIGEGQTVILTPSMLNATDADDNDATLLFTVINVQYGQFEKANNPVTSFTQQDIWDNQISFVHDGGELAPSYAVKVGDGTAETSYQSAAITFNPVNDLPVLGNNQLTINEGQTVILTTSMLSATDSDNAAAGLVFTVNNVQYGQFEDVSAPGIPITNFTQQDLLDNKIRFVHDGGESAPSYDIKVGDGTAETSYQSAAITFNLVNDLPVLDNNQLTISEGQTVVLTPSMLNATDADDNDATLLFTVINVQYGQFERVSDPGIPITSFTQQNIWDNDVRFVHDGGDLVPSYAVRVGDGTAETSYQSAAITFNPVNDLPVLNNNQITLDRGESLVLTATMLSATDADNVDAGLVFTVNNTQYGQFERVSAPGVPITNFTQQAIGDGTIRFVHDGGTLAPSYDVKVSDGALETPYQSAVITFNLVNDAPVLGNNQLTVNRGQTVFLTNSALSATDVDNNDAVLLFTVNNTQYGQFEKVSAPGVPITSFTQQEKWDNNIRFIHDGGTLAPSYDVKVGDGTNETSYQSAAITFNLVNVAPVIDDNQLTINEGQAVVLTPTDLRATDADNDNDALVFTVVNVQHGQFEKVSVPGVPITRFIQQEIGNANIRFVHDGGEIAPSFSVKVSDGALDSSFQSAAISFNPNANDVPVLGNNQLTINEGQTLVLTNSMLSAIDIDNDDAALVFTVNNIQYGQFEDVGAPGVPITSFTQQDLLDNKIRFVHDGGELAPSYDVKVSDGALDSSYQSAAITFSNINDAPVLGNNQLTINGGQAVVFTSSGLSATDTDTNGATLVFTVINVQYGQFERVSNPGIPISSFTQQEIGDNNIRFVHDGGELAPAYDVRVSDGTLETAFQSAAITYTNTNDAPVLGNNQLTLAQGQTIVLSSTTLSATDGDNDDATLTFTVTNVQNGYFNKTTGTGAPVTVFTQQEITDGKVRFVHNGGEGAPSYDVKVGDGALETAFQSAAISFTNINNAPVLGSNQLSIDEGQTLVLTSGDLSATDVDNDDATLIFTVANVQYGYFDKTPAPGVPITSFTQQEITEGKVRFVHNGGEVAPSYGIKVSDGTLATAFQSAAISFTTLNDAPVLGNNQLTINEGQTLVLTSATLSATDVDSDDATLTFTVVNVQNGYFDKTTAPGVPITVFTQQDITDAKIRFVHDGGEVAPSYEVKVSDGTSETAYQSAAITFTGLNDVPVLANNQLTVNRGQTIILLNSMLSATDSDNNDAALLFTVINVQKGQFEKASNPGIPITSFSQQEIWDNKIRFVHDGGGLAPAYDVKIGDGALETGIQSAAITFDPVNDMPSFGNNQLSIDEGQTVVLTNSMLSATDIDNEDAALVFTVINVQQGRFEKVSNPGVPITSFIQQEIGDNQILFVHDSGELAPAYDVRVSDGGLETSYQSAAITFTHINDVPVLGNNQLTLKDGQTVVLTSGELSATDVDNSDATLVFTAINVQHGQFEKRNNPGVSITSFTQQEIWDNKIRFVHDGSSNIPSYKIKVSDSFLETAFIPSNVTFFSFNNNTNASPNPFLIPSLIGGIVSGGICVGLSLTASTIVLIVIRRHYHAKNKIHQMVQDSSMSKYDHVSLCFIDIANFTKQTKSLDPQITFTFVKAFFGGLSRIAESHDLTPIKQTGDCIFVAGNVKEDKPLEEPGKNMLFFAEEALYLTSIVNKKHRLNPVD